MEELLERLKKSREIEIRKDKAEAFILIYKNKFTVCFSSPGVRFEAPIELLEPTLKFYIENNYYVRSDLTNDLSFEIYVDGLGYLTDVEFVRFRNSDFTDRLILSYSGYCILLKHNEKLRAYYPTHRKKLASIVEEALKKYDFVEKISYLKNLKKEV